MVFQNEIFHNFCLALLVCILNIGLLIIFKTTRYDQLRKVLKLFRYLFYLLSQNATLSPWIWLLLTPFFLLLPLCLVYRLTRLRYKDLPLSQLIESPWLTTGRDDLTGHHPQINRTARPCLAFLVRERILAINHRKPLIGFLYCYCGPSWYRRISRTTRLYQLLDWLAQPIPLHDWWIFRFALVLEMTSL